MFQFLCTLALLSTLSFKIDPYNFELYRFKLGTFFLRHSVDQCLDPWMQCFTGVLRNITVPLVA